MRAGFVLAALLLSGCSGMGHPITEAVYMAKGQEQVKCGPYGNSLQQLGDDAGIAVRAANDSLRACVSDYQRQGFNRVQSPSS